MGDISVRKPWSTAAGARAAATLAMALPVAVLVVAGAIRLTMAAPPLGSLSVAGRLELADHVVARPAGAFCQGAGDYFDLQAGAPIVIADSRQVVVAVGALDRGETGPEGPSGGSACVFAFTVDVPTAGAGPFTLRVGHRERVMFTRDGATSIVVTIRAAGR